VEDRSIDSATVLRAGNIVTIDKSSWLGEVMDIRGLKSDITIAVDEDGEIRQTASGKPLEACSLVWLKVRWLYSSKQFKELGRDW
jgi:hypothetical protein